MTFDLQKELQQRELTEVQRQLADARDQQAATAEVLRIISSSPEDLAHILVTILANATKLCEAKFATLYLCEGDGFRVAAMHNPPPAYAAARRARPVVHPHPDTALWRAAKAKHIAQIADITKERSYAESDPFARSSAALGGFRTVMGVPMLKQDELIGVITIGRQEVRPYTNKQIELITTFADQAVIAIVNARLFHEVQARTHDLAQTLGRLSKELDAARKLQLGMLPQEFPVHSAEQPIEMHAFIEPALEVGGDLYDCFYAAEHLCCFLVGDVAGKGAPAALFMARTSSLIRMAVALWRLVGAKITAARIVESVNREVCQNNDECMFVTAFVGLLDTQTGMLDYVNAGHPHPHLLRATAGVVDIESKPDLPLGLQSASVYHSHAVTLQPGDLVFAFSDGIIEATNEAGMMYGHAALLAALRAVGPNATSADVVHTIIESVRSFAGTAPKFDDVTALALRWLPV